MLQKKDLRVCVCTHMHTQRQEDQLDFIVIQVTGDGGILFYDRNLWYLWFSSGGVEKTKKKCMSRSESLEKGWLALMAVWWICVFLRGRIIWKVAPFQSWTMSHRVHSSMPQCYCFQVRKCEINKRISNFSNFLYTSVWQVKQIHISQKRRGISFPTPSTNFFIIFLLKW